jgi:hypothetical protein
MLITFTDQEGKLQKVVKDSVAISFNHKYLYKSFLHCRGHFICNLFELKTIVEEQSERQISVY